MDVTDRRGSRCGYFLALSGPGRRQECMAAQEARPAELLASAELDAGCAEKEGRVSCL